MIVWLLRNRRLIVGAAVLLTILFGGLYYLIGALGAGVDLVRSAMAFDVCVKERVVDQCVDVAPEHYLACKERAVDVADIECLDEVIR